MYSIYTNIITPFLLKRVIFFLHCHTKIRYCATTPVIDVVNNSTKLFVSHKKLSHSNHLRARIIILCISMLIERSIVVWPTFYVTAMPKIDFHILDILFLCGRLDGVRHLENGPLNNGQREREREYMCDVPIVWHYTILQCILWEWECTAIFQAMRQREDPQYRNKIKLRFMEVWVCGHGLYEWICSTCTTV